MPAWLIGALGLIATIAARREGGIPVLPAVIDPFERGGLQLPSFLLGGGDDGVGGVRRRRRRRRALTNSDRDDIAFIAATISKVAAGSFATQLVTRSR